MEMLSSFRGDKHEFCLSVSVSVEYYNQISTYGINGCRSTCVAASGRD